MQHQFDSNDFRRDAERQKIKRQQSQELRQEYQVRQALKDEIKSEMMESLKDYFTKDILRKNVLEIIEELNNNTSEQQPTDVVS